MARQQTNQANSTFGTATDNATGFGADASTIGSTLVPQLQQQLLNPQGYSQGDMGAMLASALGGAGGAGSSISGIANQRAANTRNDAGFTTALTEAARDRGKTAAASAEGIAGDNAGVKLQQQQNAQKMLSGLYGTDVGAQTQNEGVANDATQTGIAAGKSGWLQNMTGLLSSIGSLGSGVGAAKKAFG